MSSSLLLTVGTRASNLAQWQTDHVISLLQETHSGLACEVRTFTTEGDRTLDKPLPAIGGKGLFTAALEEALRSGEIDLAVHSLKDLPVEDPPGLAIGAIIGRADTRDVLIARDGLTLETLPAGAIVGTSSLRRQAQVRAWRPDLQVRSIRGNVETRAAKARGGDYDAVILAAAGVTRLGLQDRVSQWLSMERMLPAPGQGALAVQCRAGDEGTLALLAALDDATVRAAVTAERTFLSALGGGCAVPVAAYAVLEPDGRLQLQGLVADPDGARVIRVQGRGREPGQLGARLAVEALAQGAGAVLDAVKPLRGRRVVVTRSPAQARDFGERLAALGAEPLYFPVIRFAPLPPEPLLAALGSSGAGQGGDGQASSPYSWLIFTSANAVRFFFAIYDALEGPPPLPRLAVVGEATGRYLSERGLQPDFVPQEFTGEALALGLGPLRGQRVLLPRARIGRPEIMALLEAQGALVDDIPLYDTVTASPAPGAIAELRRGFDALTFTSPSSVRNFQEIVAAHDLDLPGLLAGAVVVAIGPVTAAEVEECGLPPALVPETYTTEGMAALLAAYYQE